MHVAHAITARLPISRPVSCRTLRAMQTRSDLASKSFSRRLFARAAILGTVALTLGCATSKVYTERDAAFDTSAAKSYAWVTEDLILIQFGKNQPNLRTDENELLVRRAMERELEAKGLAKVDKTEADYLVAFSVGATIRYRIEGTDEGSLALAGPGQKQTKGTLNIYILDAKTKDEVWHGWTSKWLSKNDDPTEVADAAVHKVLAEFK